MYRTYFAAFIAFIALITAGAREARAQGRDWSPADRAILGDFSRVLAVATTAQRVYAVSEPGIVIWLPIERRWDGPYDPRQAGMLDGVFSALADPLDESLWMARSDGLVHFQPEILQWEQQRVPARVRSLAIDLDDPGGGIRLETSSGWFRVLPGGGPPVPSPAPTRIKRAPTVEDALRANPSLAANASQILLDPRGRVGRFSAAAPAGDGIGWYLGTLGLGLLYVRPGVPIPDKLPFGLPGDRVGAVVGVPGGVWAATERTQRTDEAVTFVSSRFDAFQPLRGSGALGLGFTAVRRMVAQGSDLWLATDGGLVRVMPRDGRSRRLDMGNGLPDSRAYSVLARRGEVIVGTGRGVARVSNELMIERLAPDFSDAVYAIERSADTLWLGTSRGLLTLLPDHSTPGRLPELAASPAMQAPVLDIAWLADTLVAMTDDGLLWRTPNSNEWTLGPSLSSVLGKLRTFISWEDGFFVAGDRGFGYAGLRTAVRRPILGGDLPGVPRGLAVDEQYLWVATERGLVRWRLEAIRP